MIPFLFTLLVLFGGFTGFRLMQKKALHRRLLTSPLTEEQRRIVADQVPLTKQLPPQIAPKLEGKINLFLHQTEIIGCAGLEVTEPMRLSIAAQACLLIANSDAWYKSLRTILVYPGAFKSRQTSHDGFIVNETSEIRLGESWAFGPVVLSWPHSAQGGLDEKDGQNLVLHEFAHQLDNLSGSTNAVPLLSKGQSFAEWERVMLDAFARHEDNVAKGRKTVIDAYGAENHQEFFAVIIEAFFEKPAKLQAEEPDVYAQLSKLLHLDPVNWG
ncbi:M90 family metallopeptidase [Yoonia sp. BS5-3]|uniref:M90 family metallopeptidase n=1 Tax=Yoonia phaeophyticola TaxID=3137369 RepID=A0ABZ2V2T5_9RHOB